MKWDHRRGNRLQKISFLVGRSCQCGIFSPISVVHQGMPAMPMLRPAANSTSLSVIKSQQFEVQGGLTEGLTVSQA